MKKLKRDQIVVLKTGERVRVMGPSPVQGRYWAGIITEGDTRDTDLDRTEIEPDDVAEQECSHLLIRGAYPGIQCSKSVQYVDPQGRGWCALHEPDAERKALWEKTKIADATAQAEIEKENERLRLRVAELERRLGAETEPQTVTDAKADRSLRIGMAMAAEIFKKRSKGRKYLTSEAHLSQTELAGICALAAEYGARTPKAKPEGEDRCPHGMFFSGAGACPQCGGGAD